MNYDEKPTWGDTVIVDATLTDVVEQDVVGAVVGVYIHSDGQEMYTIEVRDGSTIEVSIAAVRIVDDGT